MTSSFVFFPRLPLASSTFAKSDWLIWSSACVVIGPQNDKFYDTHFETVVHEKNRFLRLQPRCFTVHEGWMPLRNPPVSDYFGNRIVKKRSHLVKFSIAFKKPSVKCQGLNERDTICFFCGCHRWHNIVTHRFSSPWRKLGLWPTSELSPPLKQLHFPQDDVPMT